MRTFLIAPLVLLLTQTAQAQESKPLNLSLPSGYKMAGLATHLHGSPHKEIDVYEMPRRCPTYSFNLFASTEHHGTTRREYNEKHRFYGAKLYYGQEVLGACLSAEADYMANNSRDGETVNYGGNAEWRIIGTRKHGFDVGLSTQRITRYEVPNVGSVSGTLPVAPVLRYQNGRFALRVMRFGLNKSKVDLFNGELVW